MLKKNTYIVGLSILGILFQGNFSSIYGHGSKKKHHGKKEQQKIEAQVQDVHDGDTIRVYIPKFDSVEKIRFKKIDCLEVPNKWKNGNKRAQKQGDILGMKLSEVLEKGLKARDLLRSMIEKNGNKVVLLVDKPIKRGYYGRILAEILIKGENINDTLEKTPYCYHYPIKKKKKKY